MATKPLDDKILQEALNEQARHGTASAAARALSMPEATLRSRIASARNKGMVPDGSIPSAPVLPDFGEDDVPVEDIIDHMSKRFKKRYAHSKAKEWFDISMPDDEPMGLCLMGDPHVADDGCNWPLLKDDCEIMASTPGL